ncbi:hypothetical protein [Rhodococcus sp. SORGH_AS_0303]|uniref:hypothetical protein n=1 Tax=Rhodococcus sp. SORGH_AS_0303 TaxID=3041753 RepID=UPI00277FF193|nr:hypothetical protein [Rhodococcus sp. SORGH_AS_0303]MDQ1199532.1 hypothetical protein [Rhodococcus sp. SORGH_AS_0303]
MPTMLTLGVRPRRDPEALFADLLVATVDDVATAEALEPHPLVGTACVPLSAVDDSAALERFLVRLDVAPPDEPPSVRAYVVEATAEQLGDAVAIAPGSSVVVLCPDGDVVETTALVDRAGRHPGLDAGWSEDRVADFLAVVAHAEHGFFAVATDTSSVLAVLAGTVAALRGDDVRSALRSPDLAALVALHPDAAAATREVLLGVLVPNVGNIAHELRRRIDEITGDAAGDA